MIQYKSREELDLMKASAELLAKAHGLVAEAIEPGVTTNKLNGIAQEFIQDNGAIPSFLNYGGTFPGTLCINLNEVIVHGMPSDYELRDGDLLGVDCGVQLEGFHSDSAYTYAIGEVSGQVQNLLDVTKRSLFKGIEQMVEGNRLGDISFAIQEEAKEGGVTVVRELTGHGIGRNLHEKPDVPNYGRRGSGPKLKDGMVLAIEPMFNMGRRDIIQLRDGWTIRTKDKMPSAHFEHTVAMWDGRPEIITSWKYIEEALNKKNAKAS